MKFFVKLQGIVMGAMVIIGMTSYIVNRFVRHLDVGDTGLIALIATIVIAGGSLLVIMLVKEDLGKKKFSYATFITSTILFFTMFFDILQICVYYWTEEPIFPLSHPITILIAFVLPILLLAFCLLFLEKYSTHADLTKRAHTTDGKRTLLKISLTGNLDNIENRFRHILIENHFITNRNDQSDTEEEIWMMAYRQDVTLYRTASGTLVESWVDILATPTVKMLLKYVITETTLIVEAWIPLLTGDSPIDEPGPLDGVDVDEARTHFNKVLDSLEMDLQNSLVNVIIKDDSVSCK